MIIRLRSALLCLCLAALAALLCSLVVLVCHVDATVLDADATVKALPARLDAQITAQGDATRTAALQAVSEVGNLAERQIAGLRGDVRALGDQLVTTADGRLASIQKDAVQPIAELSGRIAPVLDHVDAAVQELRPELVSAVRDVRAGVLSTDRTMLYIRQHAPDFLTSVNSAANHLNTASDESAQTAKATRIFMGNLAAMSKPLPLPIRIGLAVAPPIVQVGFTVASWAALKGKGK